MQATAERPPQQAGPPLPESGDKVSKKEQILSLYGSGVQSIDDLAALTEARPSYVGSVLAKAGYTTGYHDLYTSTASRMNAYSKFFTGRLGFRDVKTAESSLRFIDRMHRQFQRTGDRAGQHHAMMMAMVMYNRARWTGKQEEAEVFRRWLTQQLAGEGAPPLHS